MRSKLNLKRTRNKLLKNGYLPEDQESYHEKWIDVCQGGAPISFNVRDGKVDSALRVHAETGTGTHYQFHGEYTRNVKQAIELSREDR